jgi:hypothetical protein
MCSCIRNHANNGGCFFNNEAFPQRNLRYLNYVAPYASDMHLCTIWNMKIVL